MNSNATMARNLARNPSIRPTDTGRATVYALLAVTEQLQEFQEAAATGSVS